VHQPGETTHAPARRDSVLLVGGATISAVGSSLTLLAVALHLRPLGAGWVSAAMAAEVVPVIALAPLAGRLVDRLPNRQLLVTSLLLQATAVALAAALGLGPGRAGVLVAALVLLGAGSTLTVPTVSSLAPHVAGEERSTALYGWLAACGQAGFLAGFAVAGALVGATSVATALWIDAASYAVMAAAVAALRAQRRPRPASTPDRRRDGLRAAGVLGDRVLVVGVAGMSLAILAAIVVNVAEVFYVVEDLGAGPTTYGLVTAVWPAAGILGGWAARRLSGDRALLAALAGAGVLMGAGLVLAGAITSVAALAIGWLMGGFANTVQNVAIRSLVRARVAEAFRGRAFAAVSGVLQAANLAGLAAGALVVGGIGARRSLLAAGLVTAVAGGLTWVLARPATTSPSAPS
jgi:hypothetical protein